MLVPLVFGAVMGFRKGFLLEIVGILAFVLGIIGGFKLMELGMTYLDDYFEDFIAGRIIYGNYFDHVLSWWAHRNEENVLFMKYEDMKRDLRSAVSKITKFAGFSLDKETINKVVSKSTFESMKDDPLVNYSWSNIYHQDRVPFIRKGEVGDWKNYFSEEQSKRLDEIYLARCKPVDLELDFVL